MSRQISFYYIDKLSINQKAYYTSL